MDAIGQANGSSFLPTISADGAWIAFSSWASNLVPGYTNGQYDAFLVEKTVDFTDFVDRDEVRMVQRRKRSRFTLKTAQAICVDNKVQRQNFECDEPAELEITSEINFAHAPRA